MKKQKNNLYNIIIIGGGPAGMTAGIYGARENLDILLVTKDFGGQIKRKSIEIENYPGFRKISGQKLIQKFENHLKKFNVSIIRDKVVKIKKQGEIFSVSTEGKKQFKSFSVIIASGADPRPLEVPGEKELIGKGVSYCVVCDGPLYKNKTVAVIGGGNAGFEAAIFLSRIAEKIYILEYGPEIKADTTNQKRAKRAKNIEVITNAGLREIKGKNFVETIVYEDNENKKLKTLEVNGVFIEIGSIPATGFIKGLIDFNKKDEIIIDAKTGETMVHGLFAAGDITDEKYKQIIVAAGQGAKAALSASKYLQSRNFNKQ